MHMGKCQVYAKCTRLHILTRQSVAMSVWYSLCWGWFVTLNAEMCFFIICYNQRITNTKQHSFTECKCQNLIRVYVKLATLNKKDF